MTCDYHQTMERLQSLSDDLTLDEVASLTDAEIVRRERPKREFEEFEDSHIEITIRVREDDAREIVATL